LGKYRRDILYNISTALVKHFFCHLFNVTFVIPRNLVTAQQTIGGANAFRKKQLQVVSQQALAGLTNPAARKRDLTACPEPVEGIPLEQ
jgi:hypothetical protein